MPSSAGTCREVQCPTCGRKTLLTPYERDAFCHGLPQRPHRPVRMVEEQAVAVRTGPVFGDAGAD